MHRPSSNVEHKIATDFAIRLAGMNVADSLAKGEPQCGQEIISFISIQHRPVILTKPPLIGGGSETKQNH